MNVSVRRAAESEGRASPEETAGQHSLHPGRHRWQQRRPLTELTAHWLTDVSRRGQRTMVCSGDFKAAAEQQVFLMSGANDRLLSDSVTE